MRVVVAMTVVLAMCPDALATGKRAVVGTIKSHECGDFCHLIVVDARGKKHDALCGAPLCSKIEKTPKRFVGRKVRATITKDMPVDNDGTIEHVDVFTKIELLS
jgi:hypothetical protein